MAELLRADIAHLVRRAVRVVLAQRNFAVDLLEKFQPLAVGVFLGGVSDDFTLQIIQLSSRNNQRNLLFGVG